MKTRVPLLVAAALTVLAVALPLWGFRMSAPQYPGESLHLRVGRGGIAGDVHEVQTLQHLIGVRFPAEMPELVWSGRAIMALGALLALGALAGGGAPGRAVRLAGAVLMPAFLVVAAGAVQMRLYRVGHDRDPHAPLKAIGTFTPPLVGPVRVGNFTVWSYPHLGGVALLAAACLAVASRRDARRDEAGAGAGRAGDGGRMKGLAAMAVVAALAPAGPAHAHTWTVGGEGADFPVIAPAVAAARPGDTVRVRPGVYRESLVIDKPIALVGEGGPVLFGLGAGDVVAIQADGVSIEGMVIDTSGRGESGRMDAGIRITSSRNRIAGNRLRRVFFGIVVTEGGGNRITDNAIEGFEALPFAKRGDGVFVYRSADNVVAGNRISGQRDGIYFQYAPRGRAEGNVVERSRYALHDMFSDDAVIEGNTLRDSSVGANVMNSRRVTLRRNRVADNRGVLAVGVSLKECDSSTFADNELVANGRGLQIDGSTRNTFSGNLFRDNDTAVVIFSSAEQNRFTENVFTGNWGDVILKGRDSGTAWSVSGRGNRWSGYRGFDFDGDGIGELPHPVVGPFQRIEGANPLARLFLQSPAAAGLALAARVGTAPPGDGIDREPMTGRGAARGAVAGEGASTPMRTPVTGGLLIAATAAAAGARRRRPR